MGMEETENSTVFRVYPNPTNQWINLETKGTNPLFPANAGIYSMQGALILSEHLSGPQPYRFSIEGFPPGLYVVRVMAGGKAESFKVLKTD